MTIKLSKLEALVKADAAIIAEVRNALPALIRIARAAKAFYYEQPSQCSIATEDEMYGALAAVEE